MSQTTRHSAQHDLSQTDAQHTTQVTLGKSIQKTHTANVKNAFNHPLETGDVVNVNVTTSIGTEISVEKLADDLNWATVDRSTAVGFGELSFEDTPGTARLYNTGTIVLVGVTTDTEIIDLIKRVHEALRGIGVKTEWCDLEMKNIVVEFPTVTPDGNGVNLPAAQIAIDELEYEPEHFSGAVYRENTDSTCLLFSTGTVIVQGTETTLEAVQRRQALINTLETYGLINEQ